jgi:hypothetical protein
VPDADHLTAVTHPRMKELALEFLAQVDAAAKGQAPRAVG